MNNSGKITGKLAASVLMLAMILLTACTASTPLTVCHATGDAALPYTEITVNNAQRSEHSAHPNDINPAPLGGCPTSLAVVSDGKITICHVTGNTTVPYDEITVSVNGLNGHGVHEGDIIPAPAEGCPAGRGGVSADRITICHATGSRKNPYNEITVSVNGLDGHNKHQADIIPAPADGCPVTK